MCHIQGSPHAVSGASPSSRVSEATGAGSSVATPSQDYLAYVSSLPASVHPHLRRQLDWDHKGVDRDLNEIALYMLDWEQKLSVHLELTDVNIYDITRGTSDLELQR